MKNYSLFISVVKKGRASEVVDLAKRNGAGGATIFFGSGTAKSEILQMLEIDEIKKEIVLILIPNSLDEVLHREVYDHLQLGESNSGICFTIPVNRILGLELEKEMEQMTSKYSAIFTIVDRGLGDEVIEIAEKKGSKGATVMHGRGSGIEKKKSFFNITVEPEKELVFMLVGNDGVDDIVSAIEEGLDITKPGKGIIFTLPVTRATGLVE